MKSKSNVLEYLPRPRSGGPAIRRCRRVRQLYLQAVAGLAQRTAQRYPNTTWQIGAWSSWWKNAMTRLPSCWARCSHPDITCRSIHRFPPCDLRTSSRHWEARSWWPTRKPCGAFNSKTRARSFPWRSCIASAPGYSSATRSSRHRFRSTRHTFCSPPDQRASPKA